PTRTYPLPLHAALPICRRPDPLPSADPRRRLRLAAGQTRRASRLVFAARDGPQGGSDPAPLQPQGARAVRAIVFLPVVVCKYTRSEEHTSELQSLRHLV